MGRVTRLTAAVLAVVLCLPARPKAVDPASPDSLSGDWKRVRGATFEIVGNASGSDLRRFAESLEAYRQALRLVFPNVRTEGPAPTRVVVFRDPGRMDPFKPRRNGKRQDHVVGYFMTMSDMNYMVLALVGRLVTYEILYHEFTHHIVHLNVLNAPRWFHEGLAEVYSTFAGAEQDARPILGRPIRHHVSTLRDRTPIPLATLLSPKVQQVTGGDPLMTAMFYAQSWGLVHYLLFSENGKYRPALRTFLQGLKPGVTPTEEQFQAAFGKNFKDMGRAVVQYVSLAQLQGFMLRPTEADTRTTVEPMREVEAQQIQGDLLVRLGDREEGEKYLERAAKLDPADVATQLSLAISRMHERRFGEAMTMVERGLTADPRSFVAHRLHGDLLRIAGRHVEAVKAYERALKQNAEDPGSWFGASMAQLAVREPQASRTFAAVLQLDPDPSWYGARMWHAWELGRTELAIEDGRAYLEGKGWESDSSVYVALGVAMEHLRRGQSQEAAALLTEAAGHAGEKSWLAVLTGYLVGRVAEPQLMARANSKGLLTEAHTYIGLKALVEGRKDEALTHFRWVEANGDPTFLEYRMAIGELRRLGVTPR